MKASEIRIGIHIIDVFNPNKPIERQIDFDDLAMLENYKNHPLPFKPIPLTEEWLLKFGFEESENCYELEINGSISIFFAGYLGVMIDGVFSFLDKDQFYVHQLQNLYFALTNKELTLKQD